MSTVTKPILKDETGIRIAQAIENLKAKPFTDNMKNAILNVLSKVAFIDENGQEYIEDLADVFFADGVLSISAVFTQPSGDITTETPLNNLKSNLVVTATMQDQTTVTVAPEEYTLSGTLTGGKSTVTVEYSGKTTTFDCLVVYELAEATAFDGTNKVLTGWQTAYAEKLSICGDITLTSYTGGGTADMIFSTIVGSEANYVGLCARLTAQGAYELWGAGITYSNRSGNITGANERIRFVAVVDTTTNNINMNFYNVTNAVTRTRSNTYTDALAIEHEISIGKPSASYAGFIGTANNFKVYGRELTSGEISQYLGGN